MSELLVPLRTMTPVIGGGVENREPDRFDPLRTAAIRGQLRFWWRASGLHEARSAKELHDRERALWGGLGAAADDSQQADDRVDRPSRSRVEISVHVRDMGQLDPAGQHEWNRRGRLKSIPKWFQPRLRNLGYGLFPLQRSNDERRQAEVSGAGALPTPEIRHGVRFTCRIRWRRRGSDSEPMPGTAWDAVLRAVALWIGFGGVGARTRRGFGALGLDGTPRFGGDEENPDWWQPAFGPREDTSQTPDLAAILGGLPGTEGHAGVSVERPWPTVTTDMLLGREKRTGLEALDDLLEQLATFRQAPGVARRGTSRRDPGRSFWPEPDMMRLLAIEAGLQEERDFTGWDRRKDREKDHRPRWRGARSRRGDLEAIAPRAAFGMPVRVQFKDGFDKCANGEIAPAGKSRMPSLLVMRPVEVRRGDGPPVYRPCILFLRGRMPDVELKLDKKSGRHAPRATGFVRGEPGAFGAEGHAKEATLFGDDGDAVAAFRRWLVRERGYGGKT
ncbi:MAG: RAMP superfamily CRISPR-associated protein [Myxococcota bacterium]